MSGRKTITYINFLQGIPAPIVALGGMIKVFLFYPLSCVTVQKIQPETSQKLYVTQNFCVSILHAHNKNKTPNHGGSATASSATHGSLPPIPAQRACSLHGAQAASHRACIRCRWFACCLGG